MEFTNTPPRSEPAAFTIPIAQRQAPEAVSATPETARPVLAADTADAASGAKGETFQPLDMYEVGDNDRMPVPPEPPRESTVRAVMADAPPVAEDEAPEPPKEPMVDTLRAINDGPSNPTVDIRS